MNKPSNSYPNESSELLMLYRYRRKSVLCALTGLGLATLGAFVGEGQTAISAAGLFLAVAGIVGFIIIHKDVAHEREAIIERELRRRIKRQEEASLREQDAL